MESKVIGSYLKKARLQKGYSEEYLSFKLNVSQSTISNFENGKIRMDVVRLVQYCNVLDLHIQELVNNLMDLHYKNKGSGPDILYDPTPVPINLEPVMNRIDTLESQLNQQNFMLSKLMTH